MSEEGGMPGLLLLARLISSCTGSSRKAVAGRGRQAGRQVGLETRQAGRQAVAGRRG